ncbi:MAG: hypothetical protein Q4C65_00950 [Eubacteriales bacterium]|nr:hypothetical protein [Eubacteriales bacterium]
MKFFWKSGKKELRVWTILFAVGFGLGIGLICIFPERLVEQTGFLGGELLSGMYSLEINQNGLLLYSLRQRLGMAAFFVLLSAAGAGYLCSWILPGGFGLACGTVLTTLSLRYGARGTALFLACLTPQLVLFVPGFCMLLDWCVRRLEPRRLPGPLGVIIMGCFVESYVNPIIVKALIGLF